MIKKNNAIKIIELGLKSYESIWIFQQELFDSIFKVKKLNRNGNHEAQTDNYILFVEHLPVYTLGNSGDIKNLLVKENFLKNKKIDFFKTNRGGDITFHGPGQIVCYPILDLDNFFTDIHKYLRFLEEIVIESIFEFGIIGHRIKGKTGVWVKNNNSEYRKICAIGVRASRWITMHGFALNVNTDLSYYDNIIPCGIKDKGITSMQLESLKIIQIDKVKSKLKKYFQIKFNAKLFN